MSDENSPKSTSKTEAGELTDTREFFTRKLEKQRRALQDELGKQEGMLSVTGTDKEGMRVSLLFRRMETDRFTTSASCTSDGSQTQKPPISNRSLYDNSKGER
jgi:hypothetical protein